MKEEWPLILWVAPLFWSTYFFGEMFNDFASPLTTYAYYTQIYLVADSNL